MLEGFNEWVLAMSQWDISLFTLDQTSVRVSTILKTLLALAILIWVTRWLRSHLVKWLERSPLDVGTRMTIATMVQYVLLIFGISMIMQNVGLKLSALSVLAGAIGVGLGFGLQNIVSNFVSGLIVMFERPVKIGDRIEIGGIEGDVMAINARSTVLRTVRDAAAIVPNQKFITETVRNFATGDGISALQLTFKLSKDQDPEEGLKVISASLDAIKDALAPREPEVNIVGMDAGGVTIEVVAWVRGDVARRGKLQSQLLIEVRRRTHAGELTLA
jgi:small-conductance mechanosensitive channel